MLTEFINNPWFIFICSTVVSLTIAIILYSKSKKRKQPFYSIRTMNVVREISNNFEMLKLIYDGNQIDSLSVTKVAFWNQGKETIKGTDIAQADPLIIQLKDNFKLLDAEIVFTKNPANQYAINHDNNVIKMNFDYLDQGEGAIIKIVHDGDSSKNIQVKGSIMGVKKFIHTKNSDEIVTDNPISRIIIGTFFLTFPLIIFLVNYDLLFGEEAKEFDTGYTMPILQYGITTMFSIYLGLRYFKKPMPKKFNLDFDLKFDKY